MSMTDAETEYFIHDKTRGYVGNSMVWWAKNHHGYTCDIKKAHVFKRKELKKYLADDLVAYPREAVLHSIEHHIVSLDDQAARNAIQLPLT